MSSSSIDLEPQLRVEGARVGHIVGIDPDDTPLVDFPGNAAGPRRARVAVSGWRGAARLMDERTPVVLVFEDGDGMRPLIVGALFNGRERTTDVPARRPLSEPAIVRVDGQPLLIEARNEIVLRCGDASLTLRRDGRILLCGTDITSRASRVNKIKGAAVRIN